MPPGICRAALFAFLLISTPQSIAKPSPGWNKVALLTAVRNPPCSCPFSVSLHPPLAALNSEPRPGSLFIANQKLSPRAGKVARSAERGAAKNSRMPRVIPPSASLTLSSSPVSRWSLWVCSTNSAYSAVPLRGAIVSMGLRGVQGGLRGEIEIFPGPPAKKVIRKLLSLLFISTPQSRLTPCQLPGRGAFWCALQPLVQSRRAANDGPYSASYKLSAKMKGRPPVPLLLYSLSTYSASSLLGSAFRLSSLGADSSSV